MNEQSTKKITFNKSTLFNLKAELLKKQEEVQEKKQQPQHRVEFHRPPPAKPARSDGDPKTKKSFKDSLKEVDVEEMEACRKAKLALEKKSELYEHLSDHVGNSQLAERFLVDFNSKKQQNVEAHRPPSPLGDDNHFEPENDNEDSEWTEFTDCLGRTRKCHKSDLESYKAKDRELMKAINKDKPPDEATNLPDLAESPKSLLVQKTNDYLQSLREKWEQKERELLAKDKDIHYQDLLFDEARMHGVAYYSFSTDDVERQKQMEELKRRREETVQAQREAEELRRKRDALMAARVAAARARQRARAGLPPAPEEPAEPKKDFTACLLEFLTKQKEEADAKAKEEENKIREEKEKERQKLRESYIREWDVGKKGVGGKEVKPFREMTQEEYVEQQRAKRIDEFAPPQTSTSSKSNYIFDKQGNIVGEDSSDTLPTSKTWAEVRQLKPKTPPPPEIGDIFEPKGLYFSSSKKRPPGVEVQLKPKTPSPPEIGEILEQKGLNFNSSKKSASNMKYKNFAKAQEPTPIVNELDDDEPKKGEPEKRKLEENRAEVPPPPTYDYYGPVPKHSKSQKPFDSDINEAYAQGAKSLQVKESNRKLRAQYDFTFD